MDSVKALIKSVTDLEQSNLHLHTTLEKQQQRITDLTGQVQELHRRVEQAQLPSLEEQSTVDVDPQ